MAPVPEVARLEEVKTPYSFPVKSNKRQSLVLILSCIVIGLLLCSYFFFFRKGSKNQLEAVTRIDRPMDSVENVRQTDEMTPELEESYVDVSYTDSTGKLIYVADCFVIITGSFVEESYAKAYANTMKNEGYTNTGYLWIPDYPSLSGKEFFSTFIGPYANYADCENALHTLKKTGRFWYGIKVSNEPVRVEIR